MKSAIIATLSITYLPEPLSRYIQGAQWTELAIPEYTRVTKPGGWVELMEFDVPRGERDNFQRLNDACKLRMGGLR